MGGREIEPMGGRGEVWKFSRVRVWWMASGAVFLGLVVFGAWLAASGAWRAWGAVASLDGKRITRAELNHHMASLVKQGRLRREVLSDPARKKAAEKFVLDDLITQRILLTEAERFKIAVEPGEEDLAFLKAHGGQPGESKLAEAAKKAGEDVERMREELRRQLLMTRLAEKVTKGVTVTDEEVAKYYGAHRDAFMVPEAAHLRVLILASREEAERLRGQALKGADFASLARQYTTGGGKESGGDMGWVDPRMLPAAIAQAVATVPPAGVTPVIEGKGSFYVIRVEGRRGPRQIPLAEVEGQIRDALTVERKQAKFAQWFEERRRAVRIERYL